MFDRDRFVADCRAAIDAGANQVQLRDLVRAAVSDPAATLRGLGVPDGPRIDVLHHAPDLTILNLVWGARMQVMPHNHNMWAVIGIYGGGEDNIYWKRAPDGRVEAAGARSLRTGDVETLGRDLIHSVINPLDRLTGALHVYGGDFFAAERSEWNAETLTEGPFDGAASRRRFKEATGHWPS